MGLWQRRLWRRRRSRKVYFDACSGGAGEISRGKSEAGWEERRNSHFGEEEGDEGEEAAAADVDGLFFLFLLLLWF